MRKISIVLFSLLLLFVGEIISQEKDSINKTLSEYALPSEQGDLELLTNRIYEAFLTYKTGYSIELKPMNHPVGRKRKETPPKPITEEDAALHPLVVTFSKEKNSYVPLWGEDLKRPIADVESIEVTHGVNDKTVLLGARGTFCTIIVTFKEEKK